MLRGLILAAALAAPLAAGAADAVGTITILEGEALVYRGSGRVHAAEGLVLAPGDIVESAGSAFLQIELSDQTVAQFGPATKVLIGGAVVRRKPERWFYVLEGWAKVSGAKREASAVPGFDLRTPLIDVASAPAVVVLRTTRAELTLFVERGDVRVAERPAGATPVVEALRAGDHYRRKAGTRGVVNPGAMQPFLQDMPAFFRDSLPLRAERFRDRPARPKDAPDFSYADVEPWLKAEVSVRRPLVQRWRAKARDAAFRSALVANLSAHPEWDPILFPEKYLPKDPPHRRAAPPASAAMPSRPADGGS